MHGDDATAGAFARGALLPTPPAPLAAASEDWLARGYWAVAALLFLGGLALATYSTAAIDWTAVACFGLASTACWVVFQRRRRLAVRVHLLTLVVLWTAYTTLGGGLADHWIAGVGDQLLPLVFPILALTALDGALGATLAITPAMAGVVVHWPRPEDWLAGGFMLLLTGVMSFVSRRLVHALARAQAERRAAEHVDPLTGLLNRAGLLRFGGKPAARGALLLVDVDRLRVVNDLLGHAGGDALLRHLGLRLQATLPGGGTLARSGGDEFALLLAGGDEASAKALATAILGALTVPTELAGRLPSVDVHVGIATWSSAPESVEWALDRAAWAVVQARRGHARIGSYVDPSSNTAAGRSSMDLELARAMHRREIVPYYQPIFETQTGVVAGAEALARWLHPRRGLVPPADFVGRAEHLNLVIDLDRYMLGRVAEDLEVLVEHGFSGWLAVNVSASSFEDPAFLDRITALVAAHPRLRGRLVIEITETVAIASEERAQRIAARLEQLGLELAIDDFGTGYSSLAQLKHLRADHLKLDRAFVSGIGASERDEDIVELVLELGRRFRIAVIAEGVETDVQHRFLRDHGCPLVQGFGLARPAPLEALLGRAEGAAAGSERVRENTAPASQN
ncbi:MAG: bifunctional diguanylate cyclase/phosphodiesterase [Myxococcales bacterium]|nr:bifunctional diguanylate cyclase/phosphodiesterase [Myxococcales bacterium]